MNDFAIEVQGISKKYRIATGYEADTLREKIVEVLSYPFHILRGTHKIQYQNYWALKNLSFNVKRGEVLGIVGRNGAGKSTLLKILSRITEPTTGRIVMRGRVASLLEVGTGFNPELTGRENIFLNGAIIGMGRKEIESKMNDIIDFSGVNEFIDTPVKRYSSGMYVRLAFAVAAHLDADILLIDEVLAVGDTVFQRKSLNRMTEMAKNGKTVVFVSHNLESVAKLCDRVIYLKNGEIMNHKNNSDGLALYTEDTKPETSTYYGPLQDKIVINTVSVNGTTKPGKNIGYSDAITIKVKATALEDLEKMRITISVYKFETRIFSLHDVNIHGAILHKGSFVSEIEIPRNLLRPADYDIYVGGYQVDTENWFYAERVSHFQIREQWDELNEKANIGLINIPNSGKRK